MPKAKWGSGEEALTAADADTGVPPDSPYLVKMERRRQLLREKVLVLFTEEQLERVDNVARIRKMNRSELIRAAVLADVRATENASAF
jgi:hypothetical protein